MHSDSQSAYTWEEVHCAHTRAQQHGMILFCPCMGACYHYYSCNLTCQRCLQGWDMANKQRTPKLGLRAHARDLPLQASRTSSHDLEMGSSPTLHGLHPHSRYLPSPCTLPHLQHMQALKSASRAMCLTPAWHMWHEPASQWLQALLLHLCSTTCRPSHGCYVLSICLRAAHLWVARTHARTHAHASWHRTTVSAVLRVPAVTHQLPWSAKSSPAFGIIASPLAHCYQCNPCVCNSVIP